MKKLFKTFTAFLLALTLSACSVQSENAINTDNTAPLTEQTETSAAENQSEFPQREINFPSLEEVQGEYPDKTVLVWVIEETGYERNYPFRTREINEYLDSKGCGFAVCFYPLRAEVSGETREYYTVKVGDMIDRGEQADIIYSSYTYIEEGGSNAYHKYVYNGIFEPLDRFFDTELGKELYSLMPEKHWEGLRINGSIYGIDGTMLTLSDDYGYFVNAELADKYGFDVSKPIEEQLDILKKVQKEESCDVFAMYGNSIGSASVFSDIKEITEAVYWDSGEHTARCVLDDPKYTERLKLLYDIKKEGLFTNLNSSNQKSFFIFCDSRAGGSEIYGSHKAVDIDYFGNTVRAYPVFKETPSITSCNMATGVCAASSNKEKAFELLALTQTDPYLNNLLTFGIEGTDYTLADGKVDTIVNYVSITRFPNRMICSRFDDGAMAEDYTRIYEKAVLRDDTDFAFDAKDAADETFATSLIMMNFLLPADKDFDQVILELRNSLEEAGLQKVIDECNRQYREVYTLNSN